MIRNLADRGVLQSEVHMVSGEVGRWTKTNIKRLLRRNLEEARGGFLQVDGRQRKGLAVRSVLAEYRSDAVSLHTIS